MTVAENYRALDQGSMIRNPGALWSRPSHSRGRLSRSIVAAVQWFDDRVVAFVKAYMAVMSQDAALREHLKDQLVLPRAEPQSWMTSEHPFESLPRAQQPPLA
jgi:hypothetical protein